MPVGGAAVKHLRHYIENVRVHIPIASGEDDLAFLSRRGRRLSRVMIFKIVKAAAERAGVRKAISPNTIRRSFTNDPVEGGADLGAVQDMVGHASITTTQIYTHLDRGYLRDTMAQYHPQ